MENLSEQKKNAGNYQYKQKNYEAAIKLYSEAITLSPNNAKYYANRSACYMMMENYKEAYSDSLRAVSIDDQFVKCFERLVKCCLALGDVDGAEKAIKKISKIKSMKNECKKFAKLCKKLRLYKAAIDKWYIFRNYKRAVKSVNSALKIATACSTTNLLKAELLTCLGRLQEAYEILEKYLITEPSNPCTLFTYGFYLYYKKDELDECLTYMKRAIRFDPDYEKAKSIWHAINKLKDLRESANRFYKKGQPKMAYDLYTQALQTIPLSDIMKSRLLFNRALMCSKMGQINEAIDNCSRSLKINRKYFKAMVLRAQCYKRLQKYKECIKDFKAALNIEYNLDIDIELEEIKNRTRKSRKSAHKSRKRRKTVKTHYEVLEIPQTASDNDIRRAYKKLALLHHPDRHTNATEDVRLKQTEIFKRIGNAYEILSNPRKKYEYDLTL